MVTNETARYIPDGEIGARHYFESMIIVERGYFRCGCCYEWLSADDCADTVVIEIGNAEFATYALCHGCRPLIFGAEQSREAVERVYQYVGFGEVTA